MPDFNDIIRDGIRSLQVAFDKQWAAFCGLMSSTRAGRVLKLGQGRPRLQFVCAWLEQLRLLRKVFEFGEGRPRLQFVRAWIE